MSNFQSDRSIPLKGIGLFNAAYLSAALIAAVVSGNLEFLVYIGVMLTLIATVVVMHLRVGLSSGVLWALSIWGLAHMAGGLLVVPDAWPVSAPSRVLYTFWLIPERLKYDQVIHAYGFAVTTWLCWQGLRRSLERRSGSTVPSAGLLLLAACASMGLGALNEVVEFGATMLLPHTNVGGYVNTGWDLVANACGATIGACGIWLCESVRR
jgi:hypothetical protein